MQSKWGVGGGVGKNGGGNRGEAGVRVRKENDLD